MSDLKFTVNPLPDGTWRAEAILDEATLASCRDLDASFALRVVEERAAAMVKLWNKPKETFLSDDAIRNARHQAEVLRRNPGKLCQGKPLAWNKLYARLCWVPWEWLTVAAVIMGVIGYVFWE